VSTKTNKIVIIPWILLGITLILMILLNSWQPKSMGIMVLIAVLLILSYGVAGIWLIIFYRILFQKWWVWILVFLSGCCGYYFSFGPIQITFAPLTLFVAIHTLWSFWFVGVASWIFLWEKDWSLPVFAGLSIALIWLYVYSCATQPTLIADLFASLQPSTTPHPLWAVNPIMFSMMTIIPISLFSFIRHTIIILKKEFGNGITST
jgi:hypothetical protein